MSDPKESTITYDSVLKTAIRLVDANKLPRAFLRHRLEGRSPDEFTEDRLARIKVILDEAEKATKEVDPSLTYASVLARANQQVASNELASGWVDQLLKCKPSEEFTYEELVELDADLDEFIRSRLVQNGSIDPNVSYTSVLNRANHLVSENKLDRGWIKKNLRSKESKEFEETEVTALNRALDKIERDWGIKNGAIDPTLTHPLLVHLANTLVGYGVMAPSWLSENLYSKGAGEFSYQELVDLKAYLDGRIHDAQVSMGLIAPVEQAEETPSETPANG